jgi:hypothetical protein
MAHDVKRKWIPEVSILTDGWTHNRNSRYDIKCNSVEDSEKLAAELEALFRKYELCPETFVIAGRRSPHINESDFECTVRREHWRAPVKASE